MVLLAGGCFPTRHAGTPATTRKNGIALRARPGALSGVNSLLVRALLGAITLLSVCGVLAADRKPNIIMIVSDDQGYPDLGIIGSKPILTPNLDRLAREGVRGTNYYVTWCACTPTSCRWM